MFVRVKPLDDFKDTSGHFPDVFVFRQDVATKPQKVLMRLGDISQLC